MFSKNWTHCSKSLFLEWSVSVHTAVQLWTHLSLLCPKFQNQVPNGESIIMFSITGTLKTHLVLRWAISAKRTGIVGGWGVGGSEREREREQIHSVSQHFASNIKHTHRGSEQDQTLKRSVLHNSLSSLSTSPLCKLINHMETIIQDEYKVNHFQLCRWQLAT